jgi:AcrR family transcriptional regulator
MDEQPTGVEMRRTPQRTRGQQRVAAILEAAEQLFAEVGYESTTTNAIAARAQIPIGSIYQFFPNKEAILHAVANRYREGFAAHYEALAQAQAHEQGARPSAGVLAERLIGAMVEFGGAHIGFTRIVLEAHANPQLAAAAAAIQQDLHDRLAGLLAERAPWLSQEECRLYATVGLTGANAVLARAVNIKLAGDVDTALRLIDQARVLLVSYTEKVASPRGAADA